MLWGSATKGRRLERNIAMQKIFAASFVLVSLVLGGCASETEGEDAEVVVETDTADTARLGAGPTGYKPNVKLADLRAAGARCIGTHCVLDGKDWDCKGGGLCTQVPQS